LRHSTPTTVRCANCGRDFAVHNGMPRRFCNHACYTNHRFGAALQ
jgi:endogenous inhibitor of DNA gyrase (YacG/DUF329 family)